MKKPTIVLGVSEMELGSSFNPRKNYYRNGFPSMDKVRGFHQYVQDKGDLALKFEYEWNAIETIGNLAINGLKEVEIIGSFTQRCVAITAANALEIGLSVELPDDLLFDAGDRLSFNKVPPGNASIEDSIKFYQQREFDSPTSFTMELIGGVYIARPKK